MESLSKGTRDQENGSEAVTGEYTGDLKLAQTVMDSVPAFEVLKSDQEKLQKLAALKNSYADKKEVAQVSLVKTLTSPQTAENKLILTDKQAKELINLCPLFHALMLTPNHNNLNTSDNLIEEMKRQVVLNNVDDEDIQKAYSLISHRLAPLATSLWLELQQLSNDPGIVGAAVA